MRALFALWVAAWAGSAAFPQEPRPVVLGVTRAGRIDVFDPDSLRHLGSIGINRQAESVSASPDGRRLFIAQEAPETSGGCCGLFALDLETRRMCPVISPAMFGIPSADGRFLFTQKGNGGIDVFDARTLERLPAIKAPGVYSLHPSPDRRWLFGVTNWPSPSLDIFDPASAALVRRLPLPPGPATGAWVGSRFYVFSYGDRGAQLFEVKAQDTALPPGKAVRLPGDLHRGCEEPVLLMLMGAGYRLLLAEAFGFKVDRRRACEDAARGGIYLIEPSTGRVSDYINQRVHVNRMVATEYGELYVIDSLDPDGQHGERLLRIEVGSGRILAGRDLPPGTWNLALAGIPDGLIPRGYVQASPCER